jgi:hypothetical protein
VHFSNSRRRREAWNVFPNSRVEFERTPDGMHAQVRLGEALVRGERVRVSTSQGALELLHGAVRVAYEAPEDASQWERVAGDPGGEQHQGFAHVSVRDGRARVTRQGVARELGIGDETYLRGGDALLNADEFESVSGDRTAVDSAARDAPTERPRPLVVGTVRADGAVLDEFVVVAIRDVSLPQVADPLAVHVREAHGRFELRDLETGRKRFLVRADGWAVARTETLAVDAAADAPLALDFELESGATLRGSVVDDRTGLPITDAFVVSENDSTITVLSLDPTEHGDEAKRAQLRGDGAFEFVRLSSGVQILRANAPGYGPQWLTETEVAHGETRGGLVFRLQPAGGVEGFIAKEGDAPVVGAMVLASTVDFDAKRPCLTFARALSDAQGRYMIEGLSAGTWGVLNFGVLTSMNSAAYTPEFHFAAVRAGERATVDFRAAQSRQVLRGVVRDEHGQVLAGRTVMIAPFNKALPPPLGNWSSATTDAAGVYAIPDLQPGLHEVFISGRVPSEVLRVGALQVDAGAEFVHDIELPGASLGGVVRDAERNEALGIGVVVAMLRGANGAYEFVARVFTDSDGRYRFEFLPGGEYRVFAYATRGSLGQEVADGIVLVAGEARAGVDLALHPGGRLALMVRDASGAPVEGATLELVDENGITTPFDEHGLSNALGAKEIGGIKPGRWTVQATRAGLGSARAEVTITAGARHALELKLTPQ